MKFLEQAGKGLIKVNGKPLSLLQPEVLRFKVYEPLLIVGVDKFAGVDIRVRVSGGGQTSQIYAIRQAIAKSLVAYFQKYVDEHSKNQLKQAFVQYDRTLLVADNRRCEPKKFGVCFRNPSCVVVIGHFSNSHTGSRCQSQIPEIVPLRIGGLGGVWDWERFFYCICNGWAFLCATCRLLAKKEARFC